MHENGREHKTAPEILKKARDSDLETAVCKQQNNLYDNTSQVISSVYHMAKTNRQFTDLPPSTDLQTSMAYVWACFAFRLQCSTHTHQISLGRR